MDIGLLILGISVLVMVLLIIQYLRLCAESQRAVPSIDKDAAYVRAISDAMEQAQTEKEARAAVAEINRQYDFEEQGDGQTAKSPVSPL